ncbi:MAG: hypothetical protein KAJ19_05075 [Gammaproteobacteria bacterium]|nr:hypothetical protein [Gammaproteobacteria bacterium]
MDEQTANRLEHWPPRVLFVSADNGGCGFYRCFTPAYFLQEQKLCDTRIAGNGGEVAVEHVEWADLIVFQRICEPRNTAWHCATVLNKPIISENDDLYEKVPTGSTAKRFFPQHVLKGLNRSMDISDALTVTTKYLAKIYGRYGNPVYVIPNALDMRIDHWYPGLIKNRGHIVIGYHGSATHTVDFAATLSALDAIMKKHPHVIIRALGYFPDSIRKKYPNRITVRGWQPLHNYFNAIRQLNIHIGIAPIDDIPFNHAKSNLKCMEYGTIRVPWVASKVGPYIEITEKSKGGLLVKNKHRDWEKALDKMVTMPHNQRQEMGERGRKYVEKHYHAEKAAKLWYKAIIKTINGKRNNKRKKLFENIKLSKENSLKFSQVV